jgi:hypothetical protein
MMWLRRARVAYFSQPPHEERATLNTALRVKVERSYLKMWVHKNEKPKGEDDGYGQTDDSQRIPRMDAETSNPVFPHAFQM